MLLVSAVSLRLSALDFSRNPSFYRNELFPRARPFAPILLICLPMFARLSLADFLTTAPGRRLLSWESAAFDGIVEDAFGQAALQIGCPALNALAENRMQSKWLIACESDVEALPENDDRRRIIAEADALPIAAESMDLVALVHALDFSQSPQNVLREAVRVLEPEGRLVLSGFNPLGLWWLKQRFVALGARPYLPSRTMPLSLFRLKDWFALLGLEIDIGLFGIYSPGFRSAKRLERWSWLDKAGDRWAPQFSNVYLLSAVKRRPGARLITFPCIRKQKEVPAGSLPAASSSASDH